MKTVRAVFAVAVTLFMQAALAGALVDTKWLAANRESPDVLILDASPMHAKGHIPGAVPVNLFAVATFGVRDVTLAQVEQTYQKLGVDPGKRIVIYDEGGSWFAPRLFFSLSYYGFPVERLAILDGGLAKWQADGLPVTKDATSKPVPGSFHVTKANDEQRTRIPDLVAASGDRDQKVLIDALGPEYHYGATQFFNKAGHIPHSALLPAEDFYNADKTFKSPDDIRRMAAFMAIRPEQEISTYCGGGGAASVPYFALKHLAGYSKVKLSIESEMGWLQDDRDLPLWTYAAPAMMRDTEWLQSWGGRMMRMYGVSRLSVVDVRTPEAYAQGHVPFALSVPAETFRRTKDSRALGEVLGKSGVDASHEAIIVSGGGITKDAALAYVALEKAGQKKVSILMDALDSPDTLDKMARVGFGMTKEATIVGAPAKPTDMAVAPVAYAVNLRDGAGASAIYPKVYIASGAVMPTRSVDGKVIHVPYTDLLNADGTPKAAKDIWAVLSKAGVPRYAELVTFSDDPGEAAVTYYILRLMGYPDIKVLAS
jgi:thiosulfate/3-mercaptopyruvate sulfurtransferase